MAKQKQETTNDRHASAFMIRLPEIYRQQLHKLKRLTRRPMTSDVQIALEEYLAKNGLWPPEASS